MDVSEELAQLHRHVLYANQLRIWNPSIKWRLVVYCADELTLNLARSRIPYFWNQFISEFKVAADGDVQ